MGSTSGSIMQTKNEMISRAHEVFHDVRESMLAVSKLKYDLLESGYTPNEVDIMIIELTSAYLDYLP